MADRSDKDILATARLRYAACVSAESDYREDAREDFRFFAANPDNGWQWPHQIKAARESDPNGQRPCLTINKLPQHVAQVTNEMRQNRPQIKVLPVDGESDPEVADVLNGIIRHIEYNSDADMAYETGGQCQVVGGEGFWRILTEYCDDNSFDQDISIKRIRNPHSVHLDPDCKEQTGCDAKFGFIDEILTEDEFKEQYPSSKPIDWKEAVEADMAHWYMAETKSVRIAEYFYTDTSTRTLSAYQTGELYFDDELNDEQKRILGRPIRTRRVIAESIKWCKLTGAEVLDRRDWPGSSVPIIRVIGNETEIDGEIVISGLIRPAKDAQRMYNYWTSQEAEMLALAPKAPYVGAKGQFSGVEDKWRTANTVNYAYLEYEPMIEGGQLVPPPQRVQPPMPAPGLLQAKMGAAEDIKNTTAQYNASLGDRSNETSGKAIIARQREGDVANYHYTSNLARGIRETGRKLIDLIPKIYDSARIARIVGEDGGTDQVLLDPEQQQAIRQITLNDGSQAQSYNLGVGTYDVMVTVGPSYTTKRQEAAESMAKILQTTPQLWQVAGDLMVKNMDWPGAQELAERMKKLLPPQLQEQKNNGKPLPPEAQAAVAQAQQAMMMVQQHAEELKQLEAKLKDESAKSIADKAALEEARTQLVAEKRVLDAEYQKIDAQLKARQAEMDCKEAQDNATHMQSELEKFSQPVTSDEGKQMFMDVAQMQKVMFDNMQAVLAAVANPKQKQARIIENPDGSFTMQSIEAPTTVQ